MEEKARRTLVRTEKIIDTIVRQKTTVEFGVRDTKARIRRGAQ
jgi:hypothetical protein